MYLFCNSTCFFRDVSFPSEKKNEIISKEIMYFSVRDTGITKKEILVLPSGDNPKTFRLLVPMLFPSELQETRGTRSMGQTS